MTHQTLADQVDLLDIVFVNRNQAYGAYQLRRIYPNTLARSMGGAFLLIAVFFAFVHLQTSLKKIDKLIYDSDGPTVVISKKEPAPKPVQVEAQRSTAAAKSRVRFVPLLVVPFEQAPEVETGTTQEELAQSSAEVGSSDQGGNTEGPPDLADIFSIGSGNGNGSGETDQTVYDMGGVHKPPSFPGGEKGLLEYIAKYIKYPAAARQAGITGSVVVSFVINTDGVASDITVLKDPGGGCGKEVIRVVSSMPNWVPGESNGHLVRVRYYLPVRFELQ